MTMNCTAVRELLGDEDSMAPEMLRLSLLLRLVRFVSRGVSIISGNAEHHGGVLVSSYLNRLNEARVKMSPPSWALSAQHRIPSSWLKRW